MLTKSTTIFNVKVVKSLKVQSKISHTLGFEMAVRASNTVAMSNSLQFHSYCWGVIKCSVSHFSVNVVTSFHVVEKHTRLASESAGPWMRSIRSKLFQNKAEFDENQILALWYRRKMFKILD